MRTTIFVLFLATACGIVCACGNVASPSPNFVRSGGSQSTLPQVLQTGNQPVEWVDFNITGAYPTGLITNRADVWFSALGKTSIGHLDMTTGKVKYYPIPSNYFSPWGIAVGPDGNVWFCLTYAHRGIGRMTPSGSFTIFPLNHSSYPEYIVPGPGGKLWFTDKAYAAIDSITTSGSVKIYRGGDGFPDAITVGPDGNLWFTEGGQYSRNGKVGRLTPQGVMTLFSTPTNQRDSFGIATGSDGNLWFAEHSNAQIASITPTGTITEYPISKTQPRVFAATPDGLIWFSHRSGIATFDVHSHVVRGLGYSPLHGGTNNITGMTKGSDGNVWYANAATNPDTLSVRVRNVLTVSPTSLTLSVGQTENISAVEQPPHALIATSSDPAIASVTKSQPFQVTAHKSGTCTIVVSDGRFNVFDVAVTVD